MTKKKKTPSSEVSKAQTAQSTPPQPPPSKAREIPNLWFSKSKKGGPSTSALIICRNKHWRYISSFHGPWLQLPPEVLESLANSNYLSPRPQPIDPAVFYDLVKIRKAVDEATNIAVRAASDISSASLSASMSAHNGMMNSAGAEALGLGYGGSTGGTVKLSKERKHRMRELATQKLSQAYHLDEIAASVAAMQSTSTLEDLALHVLQRNPLDYDAKYVHFFHEKIPSRMMAEYTPLDPLNQLIAERPSDGSPFRTRALTRIFKDDFIGAARDLTEGLAAARWAISQQHAGKDQLVLLSEASKTTRGQRDWRNEMTIPEEDQPSSLEVQMLFHRGNVHFAIACQYVHDALDAYHDEQHAKRENDTSEHLNKEVNGDDAASEGTARSTGERLAHKKHLELRRMVKSNARKALKDYLDFLQHFDYTPGISMELAEAVIQRLAASTREEPKYRTKNVNGQKIATQRADIDLAALTEGFNVPSMNSDSGALVPAKKIQEANTLREGLWAPLPEIYPASQLFSEKVPASIPPYPNTNIPHFSRTGPSSAQLNSSAAAASALADSNESITYHPLLTDALHSLLLCHTLLQTSPTELKRHAHNAARLARICDGYPIFLAARSPARADWVEVLRRTNNWIGLNQSWELLCRPAPLPGHTSHGTGDRGWNLGREPDTPVADVKKEVEKAKREMEKERRERRKHEAILEALSDDRVVDEESFQRAVRAREMRAIEDEEADEAMAKGLPFQPRIADTPQPSLPPAPATVEDDDKESDTPAGAARTNGATPMSESKRPSSHSHAPQQNGTHPAATRWAQNDTAGGGHPISTVRAEAIVRWVREAPLTVEGAGKGKKGGKKKASAAAAAAGRMKKKDSVGGGLNRVEDLEQLD